MYSDTAFIHSRHPAFPILCGHKTAALPGKIFRGDSFEICLCIPKLLFLFKYYSTGSPQRILIF
jgi:hypothetical protein